MYRLKDFAGLSAIDYVNHKPQFYVEALSDRPDRLMTSAAVFRTVNDVPHLLLLQRSETDTLPGQWELPGGSVDASDLTLRDAVQRELKEETGLTLAWIIQEIGQPSRFTIRNHKWAKVSFVVEVDEIGQIEYRKAGHETAEPMQDVAIALANVKITLSPEEHQRHRWVTRAQVESSTFDGESFKVTGGDDFTNVLLQAFAIQDAVLLAKHDARSAIEGWTDPLVPPAGVQASMTRVSHNHAPSN